MQGTSQALCIFCHLILTTPFASTQSGADQCFLPGGDTDLYRHRFLTVCRCYLGCGSSPHPALLPTNRRQPILCPCYHFFPFTLTDLKFHECDQCKELFPTPALLQVHVKCQHSGQWPSVVGHESWVHHSQIYVAQPKSFY